MDCANVSLEMGLRLKLESASFAWELAHFFVHNLHASRGGLRAAMKSHACQLPSAKTLLGKDGVMMMDKLQLTIMCRVRSLRAPNRRPQNSQAWGLSLSWTLRTWRDSCPF